MNDQGRILNIFLRLFFGEKLQKKSLADEFEVNERTIQRDLSFLRYFVSVHSSILGSLVYNRDTKKYSIDRPSTIEKQEVLFISKILLENRALNKNEFNRVINSLLNTLSIDDKKLIESVIASEKLNYEPISDKQDRIVKTWELSEKIIYEQVIELEYKSPYTDVVKKHIVFPVSMYYDFHYFYLVAYHLKHETYTTFKIDRIKRWKLSDSKKPNIPHRNKFRDGDVRNIKVDAFSGSLIKIRLKFNNDPSIVLDQFPNTRILSQEENQTVMEIETQYTPGLKRWLLSQGDSLVITKPQKLVDDLKQTINNMLDQYIK